MTKTIIGKKQRGKTTLAKHLIKYRSRPVIIVDPFKQFPGRWFLGARSLLEYVCEKRFSIIEPLTVTPDPGNPEADFIIICRIMQCLPYSLFVIDEVDFYHSAHSIPEDFRLLVNGAFHYRVDLITTSRRPANIHRDLTANTDEFYIFRVTEKRDLNYFADLSADLPEKIRNLPPYHFIKYDCDEIIINPPISPA